MKDENYIPVDLDDAIKVFLEHQSDKQHTFIRTLDEDAWLGMTHHGTGTHMRNVWNLWGANDDLSKHLHDWFVARGIVHADDMSGIIFRSIHRHVRGTQIQLDAQIEYYQNFWRKAGFKDGKPK